MLVKNKGESIKRLFFSVKYTCVLRVMQYLHDLIGNVAFNMLNKIRDILSLSFF